MKAKTLLLAFTLVLTFFYTTTRAASELRDALAIKNQLKQLEALLLIPITFGSDTTSLLNSLKPLKAYAQTNGNPRITWAYYMLLADGFSVAFDRSNERSDLFYKKAHALLTNKEDEELKFLTLVRQGYYHFVYRDLNQALPFFLRANDAQRTLVPTKIPLAAMHYTYIANFYSYIGEQRKAVSFLLKAFPLVEPGSRAQINLVNSIGVYLDKDSARDEAFEYYSRAMNIAQQAKDSVWIGIIAGNLASWEWENGNELKAIALGKQNIELSLKYDEKLDAMRSSLELSKMYVAQKQWKKAKVTLQTSIALMQDKPYFLQYKTDAHKTQAAIAGGLKNRDGELYHLQQYILYKDSLDKRTNNENLQKIYWQWETEKYEKAVLQQKQEQQQIKQRYQYAGILLVLVFLILILLINRSRIKMRVRTANIEKDRLKVTYEKQLLDQEVVVLRNSLQEFTDTIKENNRTILNLEKELDEHLPENSSQREQINDTLNDMLDSHIMTDERWFKFKYVFDKVYPGYLQHEKANNPRYSENDLRILALTKLELSNRIMSNLLGISVEGIKKAKQRMKKKIETGS